MRFDLVIRMGNDVMREPEQVADALEAAATLLRVGRDAGTIMDINGNTVGEWAFRGSP